MTTPAPAWSAPTTAGLHAESAVPVLVDPFQHSGQLPDIISQAPRSARGFRARMYSTTPPGPPTDIGPGGKALAGEHAHPGTVDDRAVWGSQVQAGNPGHTRDDLSATPEQIANTPAGVNLVTPQNSPTRIRVGTTGADNTRAATMSRWLFGRPFDQYISQTLGQTDKIPSAAPRASLPISYTTDIPGGIPAPGGRWRAAGMEPIGIQPNSIRVLPRAWDALLVNNPDHGVGNDGGTDASVYHQSTLRARGWKA